jgi:hypothetical protein
MSMDTCKKCGQFVDTDEGNCYPYENEPMAFGWAEDKCICEDCQDQYLNEHPEIELAA